MTTKRKKNNAINTDSANVWNSFLAQLCERAVVGPFSFKERDIVNQVCLQLSKKILSRKF